MKNYLYSIFMLGILSSMNLAYASLPLIKPGVPGKKRGDIIAPMLDEQIAAWCDFDKQIIRTRTNILCAYVGDKTASVAAHSYKAFPIKMAKTKAIPKDLTPNFYEMREYEEGT